MKTGSIFFSVVAILSLSSCFNSPDFPSTPKIEFENVIFKEAASPINSDSLVITIKFEDGDGDIGLDFSFTEDKFRPGGFVAIAEGSSEVVTLDDFGKPGFEWLSAYPYEFPFECANWIEGPTSDLDLCALASINECASFITNSGLNVVNNNIQDTVFYLPNPNFNNYTLTFLEKNSEGEFVEYDFENNPNIREPCAIDLSDRIPPLSDDKDEEFPSEGRIRFAFAFFGMATIFGEDTELKLRVQIKDRALNESNEAESGVFTLESIRTN